MTPAASPDGQDTGAGLPPCSGNGEDNDVRLTRWLTAPAGIDADRALARLLEEVALPVINRIVRGKFGKGSGGVDAEDITSETRLQLIRYLQGLRERTLADGETPAVNFPAYAATVTYTVWASYLRRRYPGRAMLLNRLRYLLENRAGPQGFVLWQSSGGERLAGFTVWRKEERAAEPTPRRHWLLTDAQAAAADAFEGVNRVPTDLAALTAGLLAWLGGPLELRELTRVLAELLGLAEPDGLPSEDAEDAGYSAPDPAPSPHETLRWKEYLGWLWREVMGLPLGQRTAFLCHSSLLREMELCGLTSIRAAASALEIQPEKMAKIWSRLPLNDLDIAALLGSGNRQRIINLRKTARATLGLAWQAVRKE